MNKVKALIVVADFSDFLLSCSGTAALYAANGCEVGLIILGADTTHLSVDADRAGIAKELGLKYAEFWDLDPYMLNVGKEIAERLATKFREIIPNIIITHNKESEVYEPNHNTTSEIVRMAYTIASGAGADCGGLPVAARQTPMYGIEPFLTEESHFRPDQYINITPVIETKKAALKAAGADSLLVEAYLQKNRLRGIECTVEGCVEGCTYAEAFSAWNPVCSYDHFVW